MKKAGIFIKIFYLLLSVSLSAEEHHFYARYTNQEGLTGSHIRSCTQDGFGRLWVGTGNGVYYFDGTMFRALAASEYMQNCTKMTFSVECDSEGRVWIASGYGAGYYDTSAGTFNPLEGFGYEPARDLDKDGTGAVWLTTRTGIWKYDRDARSIVPVFSPSDYRPDMSCFSSDGSTLYILSSVGDIISYELSIGRESMLYSHKEGNPAVCISSSGSGGVLAVTESGSVIHIGGGSASRTVLADFGRQIKGAEVNAMMERDGSIWIGISSGLIIYDTATGSVDDQTGTEENRFTLSGQTVREIFEDRDGNVWVGTANGGLCVWMSYGGALSRYVSDGSPSSIAGKSIRAICADANGFIWTGSEEGQVCRFDPAKDRFTDFSFRTGIRYGTVITSIKEIEGMLWIATYGDGLYEFDPVACRTVRRCSAITDRFFSLMIDRQGSIRAGSDIGIFSVDKASGILTMENPLLEFPVHTLAEDGFGRIWLGTYGQGVGYWVPGTPDFINIPYSGQGENPLSSNYINYLFVDSLGNLWICSEGSGLARIKFTISGYIDTTDHLDRRSGMPSNDIRAVMEDPDGDIWAFTSDGIVELDPATLAIRRVYMQSDGIVGKFFDAGACLMNEDGRAYAGTNLGMLSFASSMMKEVFESKGVHINRLATASGGTDIPLAGDSMGLIGPKGVRIGWKDASMVSVSYSTYDYANPNLEMFNCELKRAGFTSTITTGDYVASYAGLKPGRYTFTVSPAEGGSDVADSIRFSIIPPWYRSVTANIAYLMLIGLALTLFIKRKKDEHERVAKLKEAQNNMQILHNQMNFLTNVTHEIRTPVTMMTILMDRIFKKKAQEKDEDLVSMKSNMNRLLELCDQMLDYRKVEGEQIKLHPDDEPLDALVRAAAESFRQAAEAKGMEFKVQLPQGPVLARCDRNAVEGILSNLLSNAVKYGASKISMTLSSTEKEAVVSIENDGELIHKDESELIFNAFYQTNPKLNAGTGLGLTYSRALANMQNGRLFFDQDSTEMNRFVFTLPLSVLGQSVKPAAPVPSISEDTEYESASDGRPLILVAEDNAGLRKVICEELKDEYNTVEAANGAEALDIIKKENVDMLVSDIMMPVMDGCELCDTVKSDVHTSHIMVILLTAAIGVDNHIKSLKAGADNYIEKPFRVELLKESINNLFRNRQIRNEQFSSSPLSHFRCASYSTVEQEFMDAVNEYIHEHISDSEMTTDQIAAALNTTRKTLSHKIQANTGMTVTEYVRTCRLKKAAELLAKHKYRINEVVYLVGYSTPSYFTKQFTEQFGMKPSEFIQTL